MLSAEHFTQSAKCQEELIHFQGRGSSIEMVASITGLFNSSKSIYFFLLLTL